MVQYWSNFMEYDILGTFFIIFTSKKLEMNQFSGSSILWSILREHGHLTEFVGGVRGFWVGHMVPKLAKIA